MKIKNNRPGAARIDPGNGYIHMRQYDFFQEVDKMKFRHARAVKTFIVLIAAAAFLAQPSCRSLQNIPGQWLAVPAGADGRLEDFSKKITSHLFENGMMVGVGNDDRSLYIFFSPDIRHQQRPPSRARLTLWLDENGGSAKRLGLVHVSDQDRPKMPKPEMRPGAQKDLAGAAAGPQPPPAAAPLATVLKIVDRKNGKEIFINAEGSLGPAVRLADDWGDFAYQWRIPLQAAAGGEWPGIGIQPGKPIGIGLLWEIAPLPGFGKKELAGRFPLGGPDQGGAEMGPPPGREGGPGRGMPADNFKSRRTIWLKIIPAQKL